MHTREHAIKTAGDFIQLVKKSGIRVSEAFLFGSYARNSAASESDVDVAVVSPDFSGFRYDDLGKIAYCKLQSDADLEIHTFAIADFTIDNPFAREIIETGLKVA
jgi:uncharacterized protein